MTSVTDIYNLALTACGDKGKVASPTEKSRGAELCQLWYEPVRDQVLHAAYWPSARGVKRLALLRTRDQDEDWVATDPDPDWTYAYSVPADMLRPRFLHGYGRFELSVTNDDRKVISTNVEDAILQYTRRQETPGLWDAELHMAIVYALAAHIAIPLTGKNDRMRLNQALANELIMQAQVSAANTDQANVESTPPWLVARGYESPGPDSRYVYPTGQLISVSDVS